jgi:peroxiredoxin
MRHVLNGILTVLSISLTPGAFGQTRIGPPRAEPLSPQEQLATIVKAHQDARGRFFKEFKATTNEGEIQAALGRYFAEIDSATEKAMRFARTHAQEPLAVDALRFVVRAGQARHMGKPTADPLAAEALAILRRDHVRAPGMGEFCEYMVLAPHDPAAESLIRDVLEQNPNHDQRGLACHALAVLRREQAHEIRWLLAKPEDRKPYEDQYGDALKSFENVWGKELIARFLKYDPNVLDAEADALLERVVAEFGTVPHEIGTKQKALADLANAELFERRDLAIGKTAPEIVGQDHEGKEFKLSDYRGRVVLLTFSGNWCGPCRAMYQEERDLVERFKDTPFVLLSVNTDEARETLRKSIESREITWRCWWDGRTGPITLRWGVMQFPAVYLLDGDGVIRAKPQPELKTLGKAVMPFWRQPRRSRLAETPAR